MKLHHMILCVVCALQASSALAQNPCVEGQANIGNDLEGITFYQNYVYVADDWASLHVVDISDASNPEIVGVSAVNPGMRSMTISGTYMYVSDSQIGGIDVMSLSNPAYPVSVNWVPAQPGIRDIATSGNYAYAVNGAVGGFSVFDISNPLSPTPVGSIEAFSPYRIAVAGDYAFLACHHGGVKIVDVSDPTNPTIDGTVLVFDSAQDIVVSGDYAYVADRYAGMTTIDVSDPEFPLVVGSADMPGDAQDIALFGDYVYVANGDEAMGVIDVEDPANPFVVGLVTTVDNQYLAVSEDFVFTTNMGYQFTFMKIFNRECLSIAADFAADVTTGAAPVQVQFTDQSSGGITGWYWDFGDGASSTEQSPSHTYSIGGSFSVSLTVSNAYGSDTLLREQYIEIDDCLVSSVGVENRALGIDISGNYAYLADNTAGVRIVDVTDPFVPMSVGSLDTAGWARRICVSGNFAYVADGYEGMTVIDVSDPFDPVIAGSVDTDGIATDVSVSGGYAYVADGYWGVAVVDINDPAAPFIVSTEFILDARGIDVYGSYAYVAKGFADDDDDFLPALKVIDISDPLEPAIVGSVDTYGSAEDVAVSGSYAYVADSNAGVTTIDISTPTIPVIVDSVDTDGSARDIVLVGNYAFVADGSGGLVVINISDPGNLVIRGSAGTVGGATGVALAGDYAFVTQGYQGMAVFDKSCLLPASSVEGGNPAPFLLNGNYPNPFNPRTTIRYSLPNSQRVQLGVYDIGGRLVATLVDSWEDSGSHTATWNGLDRHGHSVGAGVYFYRLTVSGQNQAGKMTLLK